MGVTILQVFRGILGPLLLAHLIMQAQPPAIGQDAVFNSASRIPPSLPGGALTRGGRFQIEGVRLAGNSAPVVSIAQGEVSVNARLIESNAERIDAVLPMDAPLGKALLKVQVGAESSAPAPITIVDSSVGLYSRNREGWGPGRIRNLSQSGVENAPERPAHPGERLGIAATGSGSTPTVFIGGRRASVLSVHSLDPGNEEIVVQVPADVPSGCFVPVFAQAGDAEPSNVVTAAIRHAAGHCEVREQSPEAGLSGKRVGAVVLSRVAGLSQDGQQTWTDDSAIAAFVEKASGQPISPFLIGPPEGTCTAYTGNVESRSLAGSFSEGFLNDLGGHGLDLGDSFTLREGDRIRQVPRTVGASGHYSAPLGTDTLKRRPLFLNPGSYTLTSPGGHDSGGLAAKITLLPPFNWTNRQALAQLDRKKSLTVTWDPARADDTIVILASNVNSRSGARAVTYCVSAGSRGKFTIPAAMLAHATAGSAETASARNQLIVAGVRKAAIPVPGFDSVTAISISAGVRLVDYR